MRMTAEVVFECAGPREARSLMATLHADNRSIPKDQRLRVKRDGGTLRFVIDAPRPVACVASVLSLLSDANLFQQVWALAS